jgi:hypothetical protein
MKSLSDSFQAKKDEKLTVDKKPSKLAWQSAAWEVNLYLARQPHWDLKTPSMLFAKARRFGEGVFLRKFQEYKDRHDGKGSRYFLAMFREK